MRKDCFAPKARLRSALSHPAGWDSRHSPPPAPPCLAAPLTARPCWGSRRRPLLHPGWWPLVLPAPLCSSLLPAACWTCCRRRLLDQVQQPPLPMVHVAVDLRDLHLDGYCRVKRRVRFELLACYLVCLSL